MATNTEFTVANLEFDSIKSNLKTFMEGQDVFKDYDFAGSSLNVLLDVLAYNTYYNGVYLNHVASEMFLDSAQIDHIDHQLHILTSMLIPHQILTRLLYQD